MIGIVYLGNNPETQERLKYIPGRLVQFTTNYKDGASACAPHVRNEHFIMFYEQSVQAEDITAITYIKKKCKNVYLILLTHQLTLDDRKMYQKCGINDTILRFLFGNVCSTFSSPFWASLSSRQYSSSQPLPSVWRARDPLFSNPSESARTTPFLIS